MGRQLYETLPAADVCSSGPTHVLGYDLAKLCFEDPAAGSGFHGLQPTGAVCDQPGRVGSRCRLESPGVVASCAAAAGLSLGEYTALVFAGVMDFEAACAWCSSAAKPCRRRPTPRPAAW